MKTRIFRPLILLIVIGALVYFSGGINLLANLIKPSTAYAVGDLTVNWGVSVGQPIFNLSNFAPDSVQSHVVNVSNGAPTPRPVAVRGILTSQTQNLANVLDIVISDGVTDLYGGTSGTGVKTLAQFFADSALASGIPLSIVNSGANKNYTFKVTFKHSAGNEFQNANIIFDLQIGVGFDLPLACQNINFPKGPIFGTAGNDHVNGTNGNDLIVTFEGKDTVSSGNGSDCIVSENGDNNLDGGNGADTISAGNGKNVVSGGNDDDTITLGNGNNKVDGGNSEDKITIGSGNNNIDSGNGEDQVNAGNGVNKVSGGNGNDVLITAGNLSSIDGGNGKDKCVANIKKNCEI